MTDQQQVAIMLPIDNPHNNEQQNKDIEKLEAELVACYSEWLKLPAEARKRVDPLADAKVTWFGRQRP